MCSPVTCVSVSIYCEWVEFKEGVQEVKGAAEIDRFSARFPFGLALTI